VSPDGNDSMTTSQPNPSQWQRHADAESFLLDLVDQVVAAMPRVQDFQSRLMLQCNTQLVDWLDHLVLTKTQSVRTRLVGLGFEPEVVQAGPGDSIYHHRGAAFLRLVLRNQAAGSPETAVLAAAIRVDDTGAFLCAQRVSSPIQGSVLGPYRRARIWQENSVEFFAVERRGDRGFVPQQMAPGHSHSVLQSCDRWMTRPRIFDSLHEGMQRTLDLARSLVRDVGTDLAGWAFIEAEQTCWQQRNRAAQVQKARQDSLGLGWANRDHCAFRSSRQAYPVLIEILETFGFRSRERFYAGAEAGWGAQVMEHDSCQFAVFADVDLSPDEVEGDFAHRPLPPLGELGTIGLWCALHGDAMLAAGPHHFACRLDFDAARAGLSEEGIESMQPFSDFPYLKQAFTRGERWSVRPQRLQKMAAGGQITQGQSKRFADRGAVSSHLELIQRSEGFKGFNQQTVSDIIRRTDPRVG